ncbi:MAG: PAS domain-containing protein, partial [Sulfobacillus sp.]
MRVGWYRMGRDGTCASWSSGAQEILGWEECEIMGQNIHCVIHEDGTTKNNCQVCRLHSIASSEEANCVRLRDRSGRTHDVEILQIPTTETIDPDNTMVVFRESEKGILRLYDELSRKYEIISRLCESVVHIRDLRILHKRICRILVASGGFRMAWIGAASDIHLHQVDIVASAGMAEAKVRHFEFS